MADYVPVPRPGFVQGRDQIVERARPLEQPCLADGLPRLRRKFGWQGIAVLVGICGIGIPEEVLIVTVPRRLNTEILERRNRWRKVIRFWPWGTDVP